MSTEYENWLRQNSKCEVTVGIPVWATVGAFAGRLCSVVSLNGDRALIRSSRGGLDWVEKNTLDTETEIK